MQTDAFLKNYLHPALDRLDRNFTLPLPDEDSLDKTAEFIVQSHCPPTYSINVIARYENSDTGMRLVEVYKSSQNFDSGKFVRLVGSMALVKKGYPFLFFDAAVTNIDFQTGDMAPLATRMALHVPQAADAARQTLLEQVMQAGQSAGFSPNLLKVDSLPPFWGQMLSVRREGVDFQTIALIRKAAWQAYGDLCSRTAPQEPFDYQPVQQQMILANARAEHSQFQRMDLAVPVEAQAAFFSILCAGV